MPGSAAPPARTGRLIDQFRDRLVFPIRNGEEIHGFIGRRNPAKGDDRSGPKYLNTAQTHLSAQTHLFDTGAQL